MLKSAAGLFCFLFSVAQVTRFYPPEDSSAKPDDALTKTLKLHALLVALFNCWTAGKLQTGVGERGGGQPVDGNPNNSGHRGGEGHKRASVSVQEYPSGMKPKVKLLMIENCQWVDQLSWALVVSIASQVWKPTTHQS